MLYEPKEKNQDILIVFVYESYLTTNLLQSNFFSSIICPLHTITISS